MKTLIVLLASALSVMPAYSQKPRRALPDDNLAYPVLITFKNSTGSGFYVNAGTKLYLVTAKHVLFDATGAILEPSFDLLSYSKDLSDRTPNALTVDVAKAGANIIKHPSEDIAVVRVFSVTAAGLLDPLPGVNQHTVAKNGYLGVDRTAIKTFDQVLTGNEVILLGYPTSLSLQTLPQIDPRRPLLRKGIVAGQNPATHSIILDCPAYFGNSGGPVIEVDDEGPFSRRFNIIGVVSQFVPYADGGKTFFIMANSGYSVATPMDYVLELIK